MPQPMPSLAVCRLGPEDAATIAALYRAGGRDGAWCGADTVRALCGTGAVWWGGFADGVPVWCAACAPFAADTPQAAALRGALAPECGCRPEYFLLPPGFGRQGETLAGALLPLLAERLFPPAADAEDAGGTANTEDTAGAKDTADAAGWNSAANAAGAAAAGIAASADGANEPQNGKAKPAAKPALLLAALAVKAPAPVLAAYFAAGFAAVRMRPLVSLRPHYLLRQRSALQQGKPPFARPLGPKADALRRVYLPLADTLAVSRLLEQGFCGVALCRSSAEERLLLCMEREDA